MNPEEAKLKFEEIKEELFKVLGIANSINEIGRRSIRKNKRKLKSMLKKLRESKEKFQHRINEMCRKKTIEIFNIRIRLISMVFIFKNQVLKFYKENKFIEDDFFTKTI